MTPFIRWTLLFLIGYPFQILCFIIYPFLWLFWRLRVYTPVNSYSVAQHEPCPIKDFPIQTTGHRLITKDDHGAFTMFGGVDEIGLAQLLFKGNFIRGVSGPGQYNLRMVSGDVVVAFCFAAVHPRIKLELIEHVIRSAAWNYLKNLGTLSYDESNSGSVSNRCNNFGINFCPDSSLLGIGQPMAGPQFYTNSCLFVLASQYSKAWKFVFWAHWILFGGWYWAFAPVIYTKNKPVHYARDITMKSLWVHKIIFGNRWWIKKPMQIINELNPITNALFRAMNGADPGALPEVMNAFFSQKADCASRVVPQDMNPYLKDGIWKIYEQAKA